MVVLTEHIASPPTALDLLERIQRHTTNIGERTLSGLSTITPEQLALFDTLDLPKKPPDPRSVVTHWRSSP